MKHDLDFKGLRFASSLKEPKIKTRNIQLLLMVAKAELAKLVQYTIIEHLPSQSQRKMLGWMNHLRNLLSLNIKAFERLRR